MHSEDYLSEKRSLNLKINVIIVSEKLMIRMIERSLRMIVKPFVTKSISSRSHIDISEHVDDKSASTADRKLPK